MQEQKTNLYYVKYLTLWEGLVFAAEGSPH